MAKTTATKPVEEPVTTPPVEDKQNNLTVLPASKVSASMFEDDEGAGRENMGADDIAIPRLYLLQSNSPQVARGSAKFIQGAKAGDIFNNVTGEVYDGEKGIRLIPVFYRRNVTVWNQRVSDGPQVSGGGIVADLGEDETILKYTKKGGQRGVKDVVPGGNHPFVQYMGKEVVVSREFYVFQVDETGAFNRAVLSFQSTQIKKAKRWGTMITELQIPRANGTGLFNPAMFYRSYLFTSVPESKETFNWLGWQIRPDKNTIDYPGGDMIYLSAREFRKLALSGEVKVADIEADEEPSSHRRDDDQPEWVNDDGGTPPLDDEIPF